MPLLTDAQKLYLGGSTVHKVYLGNKMAWPATIYDPATKAYLDATGLPLSYAPALDGLVKGLKTTGLWSKMKAVYPFIGGTAVLHKWNLIDPRDTDDAYRLTFTGGQHSTSLGYRPNPQGQQHMGNYADTHLIPSGTLTQTSTHLSWYSLAEVPAGDRCEMGCYNWAGSGSRFHIIARYSPIAPEPEKFYYGMSEDGITGTPMSSSTGLFVATRLGVNLQSAYRNGAHLQSSNQSPISLPPVSVWVGGINSYSGRSDLPCGFASIGSGLDAQNNADLYTVVQAYQTALGRAVS